MCAACTTDGELLRALVLLQAVTIGNLTVLTLTLHVACHQRHYAWFYWSRHYSVTNRDSTRSSRSLTVEVACKLELNCKASKLSSELRPQKHFPDLGHMRLSKAFIADLILNANILSGDVNSTEELLNRRMNVAGYYCYYVTSQFAHRACCQETTTTLSIRILSCMSLKFRCSKNDLLINNTRVRNAAELIKVMPHQEGVRLSKHEHPAN